MIMDMKEHIKIIQDYCRNDFYASETYQKNNSVHVGTWASYDDYEIVSETKLKVKYKYGYGDYEYYDSYIINLTDEHRDKIIKNILFNK